jgi:ribosomal protein S27AE
MSLPHDTGDLSTNVCPKCKATSEEVLNMHKRKRVGWYCLKCYYFEEAILRETTIYKVTKVHI